MAKMSSREIRSLAPKPASDLAYQRVMVELRKRMRAAIQRDLLAHIEAVVPGLRKDAPGPDEYLLRFANLEVSLGQVVSDKALRPQLEAIAANIQEHSKGQLAKVTRVPVSTKLANTVQPFVHENINLIRKMNAQMLSRMKDIVTESVQAQTSYKDLSQQIEDEFGVGRARARLIARDQTLKYNGQVTEQLHKDAGVTSYVWTTAHDERVRGTPGGKWPRGNHYELDGQRFSYAQPPMVDKKSGRRANPGYDYQCRCVATPYTDDLLYGED